MGRDKDKKRKESHNDGKKSKKKRSRSSSQSSSSSDSSDDNCERVQECLSELLSKNCGKNEILAVFGRIDEGESVNLENMTNREVRKLLVKLFETIKLHKKKDHKYLFSRPKHSHEKFVGTIVQHLSTVEEKSKQALQRSTDVASSGPVPRRVLGPSIPAEMIARLSRPDSPTEAGPAPFDGTQDDLHDLEIQQINEQWRAAEEARVSGGQKTGEVLKRQEWMTQLPEMMLGGALGGALMEQKGRTFRKTGIAPQDATWALAPEEREKAEKKKRLEAQSQPKKKESRPPAPASREGKSLLEQHLVQQKKDKSGEDSYDREVHPWQPFDRDRDLQSTRSVSKGDVIKMAKSAESLNSRFSRGS